MEYYLKVIAPKKVTDAEFEKMVKEVETQAKRKLAVEEVANYRNNLNAQKDRLGTIDMIETLVFGYSPMMREVKSQVNFYGFLQKYKDFDYTKGNYFTVSQDDHDLLIKLMSHDNYVNRTQDGKEVPVRDIAEILHDIFNMPNVKPVDFEKTVA